MERDALLELHHTHNFLGEDLVSKEWRIWVVIVICAISMVIEIVCGILFGSLALVADGIHLSTHALAFFITASAYSYSRNHAHDPRFVFGTGKVGELASFTAAVILLAIAIVIIYEGVDQFINPVALDFIPALIVSFLGLGVNIVSALVLGCSCGEKPKLNEEGDIINHHSHGHGHGHSHGHSGHEFLKDFEDEDDDDEEEHANDHGHDHGHGNLDHGHDHGHGNMDHGHDHGHEWHMEHDHSHGHGHGHSHGHGHNHDETFDIETTHGLLVLSIFEDGIPPEFRIVFKDWQNWTDYQAMADLVRVTTIRPNGQRQTFMFEPMLEENCLRSTEAIPEPHEFSAEVELNISGNTEKHSVQFKESEGSNDGHSHNRGHHDHAHNDIQEHDDEVNQNQLEIDRGHGHGHGHDHDETFRIKAADGTLVLSIFEEGIPPEFRLAFEDWKVALPTTAELTQQFTVTTIRNTGKSQVFNFKASSNDNDGKTMLRSTAAIPEPHEFHVEIRYQNQSSKQTELYSVDFHESHAMEDENENAGKAQEDDPNLESKAHKETKSEKRRKKLKYEQDNNFRAALLHVAADAFVSVLTILAIVVAGITPAWWTNPMAGIIGSIVIISWGIQLITDTTFSLLDISPDPLLNDKIKNILESDGNTHVVDLHIWKLGPGKLGIIVSLATNIEGRSRRYYAQKLKKYKPLSHITIEIYDMSSVPGSSKMVSGKGASTKNLLFQHFEIDDHNHGHGHDHSH